MSKSRPCTVCESKHRHQIEIGLTHNTPARVLATKFGLSRDAIYRHAKNHTNATTRAAILTAQKPTEVDLDALRESESEGLLSNLVAQRARLQKKADLAIEWQDIKGSVAAENAITANLTLSAKLLGQLVQHHETRSTSILISPDYLKLRATLVDALRPFPDAMRAVGAALHRMESDVAKDITDQAPKAKPAPVVIDATRIISPPPPIC